MIGEDEKSQHFLERMRFEDFVSAHIKPSILQPLGFQSLNMRWNAYHYTPVIGQSVFIRQGTRATHMGALQSAIDRLHVIITLKEIDRILDQIDDEEAMMRDRIARGRMLEYDQSRSEKLASRMRTKITASASRARDKMIKNPPLVRQRRERWRDGCRRYQ